MLYRYNWSMDGEHFFVPDLSSYQLIGGNQSVGTWGIQFGFKVQPSYIGPLSNNPTSLCKYSNILE